MCSQQSSGVPSLLWVTWAGWNHSGRTFVPGKSSSMLVIPGFLCLFGGSWRPTLNSITSFLTFLLMGGAKGNFQQKEPVFPHLSIKPRHKFICCPWSKAVWSIWKAKAISECCEGTGWAPSLPRHKRAGLCVVLLGMSPSEQQGSINFL